MSASTTPAEGTEPGRDHLVYNLAGIAVLVLLVAVGAAYMVDRATRSARPALPQLSDADRVTQTVAGRDLSIPANWFRFGEDIKPGFASQVDLSFQLALDPLEPPVPVDVTLLSRTGARASSTLLDGVYLHQFVDGTVGGIPGLVGKPLVATEGYAGETVWYDPLSPAPFVAKCAAAPQETRKDKCLRTIHLANGLAVVLGFDAEALAHWKRFDEELALWLGQIGAL
ncbi:hypothetical protein [Devosia sediminis]|uniref:Uncharacterized protein n=1 Tax=Devosia sediminis TaxID=2798801 RepID=A0A934MQ65_9HYPH|nr:hypothetical protein [Devosia sediminis]MBJ3784054.1 hypothetical protein [Devosia sediminis]